MENHKEVWNRQNRKKILYRCWPRRVSWNQNREIKDAQELAAGESLLKSKEEDRKSQRDSDTDQIERKCSICWPRRVSWNQK